MLAWCVRRTWQPARWPSEIIRAANEVDADLVVMTTHSIAWPGQAYLGSVADGVVAHGGRPVLLLRREPPAGESAMETATHAAIQTPV